MKIEEVRGEGRMQDCDEGMWTNDHPFIRLSGPPVVTVPVAVSANSLLSIGGRRTQGFMHPCLESNDVFKEYKTTLISKGQINGYFARDFSRTLFSERTWATWQNVRCASNMP